MTNKRLTAWEKGVTAAILERVYDCMQYDDDYGNYIDGDRFILTLNKAEMADLKSVIDKLNQ